MPIYMYNDTIRYSAITKYDYIDTSSSDYYIFIIYIKIYMYLAVLAFGQAPRALT